MTKGLTQDSEGEEIDYNRVDTALKTVGITLKDAQGQFRDFDDVILELGKKWNTLDSVTRRYIATIFAGNRQQSRFLALVGNTDRYMEVSKAAAESEDAGLLQYSKTLDSLETKLNNVKTSFQQFYMDIFNGEFVKGAVDGINDIIKGFNKLGKVSSILNLGSLIGAVKVLGTIFVSDFSNSFSQISTAWKGTLGQMTKETKQESIVASQGWKNGWGSVNGEGKLSLRGQKVATAGMLAGSALTVAGSAVAANNQAAGASLSAVGNALSIGAQLAMINPILGAVGAGLAGLITLATSWPSELERAQQEAEKAAKEAEEANIERARKQERARNLEETIDQLKELEAAQYDSEEAQKAYIDASNAAFEKFPELTAVFDEAGNAIINASDAEQLLISARLAAAQATIDAAAAENKKVRTAQGETWVEMLTSREYGSTEALKNIKQTWSQGRFLQKRIIDGQAKEYSDQLSGKNELGQDVVASTLDELLGTGLAREELVYLNKLSIPEIVSAFDKRQRAGEFGINQQAYEEVLERFLFLADGITEEETYNDYLAKINKILAKNETNQKNLKASEQAIAIAEINDYFTQQDINNYKGKGIDWQTEIEGATEQFQQTVLDSIDYSEIKYDKKTGEIILSSLTDQLNLDELFSQYENLQIQLRNSFKIDEYNELIKKATSGQVSISEYDNQLTEIFGADIPEIVKNGFLDWEEEANKAAEDLQTSLSINREVDWNSLKEDITLIPKTFYDEISSFANKIDELIEGQSITAQQGQAIAEAYTNLWNSINTNVSENLRGVARNLLANADLTSIGGIIDFQVALEEENIVLDGFDFSSLISNLSINVVTEYQNLQSKLASNLDTVAKALEDASSGISSVEEAVKMANKLGVSLGEFRVEDGKFYFDDIEKLQEAYGKNLSGYSEQLYNTLDKYIQEASNLEDIWESPESLEVKTESLTNEIDKLSKKGNLDKEEQAILGSLTIQRDILNQFSSSYQKYLADGGTDSLTDFLIDYRETEMEAYSEVTKQLEDQLIADINYDNALRNLTKKYGGDEAAQKRQQALESLISSGGQGLSYTELSQLELDYFGLDEQGNLKGTFEAVRQADGTYDIAQSQMAELSTETGNAAARVINENVQSAIDAIVFLGEQASQFGGAEKGIYAETFSKAVALYGYEKIEEYVPGLIAGAVSGDFEKQAGLRSFIANEISSTTDSLETQKAYEKLIAAYKDGLTEAKKEIFNIEAQALEDGFISEQERITLTNAGEVSFLADFDTAIAETGVKRAQAIFDLVQANIDNQVKEGLITELDGLEKKSSDATKRFETIYADDLEKAYKAEAKTSISEGDRLFNFSELGQLFVASGKTFEQFVNDETGYIKAITESGEAILDIPKLLQDGIITEKEYAQFQRNFAKETFGSAEDLITRMASEEDVYADEIESFFDSIGATLEDQELADGTVISGAEYILQNGVDSLLSNIEAVLLASGVEQPDISQQITELQAKLIDLLLNSISSGISSLSSGIEGTLGAADYQALVTKHGLSGNAIRTSRGYQLSASDQQTLISSLYGDAREAGLQAEFGDQIWEVWRDNENSAIEGYTDIEEAIANCYDEQGNLVGATQDYVEALQQARTAAIFDENAIEFAFMEQDATEGLTKNFDKFVSGIDNVKSAFDAFQAGGAIGYQDFYNIMDYMNNFGAGGEGTNSFIKQIEAAGYTYESFVNSVVENTDKWGKVDIGGVAAEMGISVDTAMEGMATGMEESLQEVAKQQIKYLSGVEKMLEAMLLLQSVGNVDLSIGLQFTTSSGETIDYSLESIKEAWDKIPEEDHKNFLVSLETQLVDRYGEEIGGNIFNAIGGDGYISDMDQALINIAKTAQVSDEAKAKIGEISELNIDTIRNILSSYSLKYEQFFNEEGDYISKDAAAGFQYVLEAWYNGFASVDTEAAARNHATEVSAKMAELGSTSIPLKVDGFKYQLTVADGQVVLLNEQGQPITETINEEVANQIAEAAGEALGGTGSKGAYDAKTGQFKFDFVPEINTESINADFTTAAAAAETLKTAIAEITAAASAFQSGTGFQDLATQLNIAATAAEKLSNALVLDKPLQVDFNAENANGQVTALISNLLQLNTIFQPTVTVEDAEAQATIADVLMQLENVGLQNPTPQIDVDDQASEQLRKIINLIASISSKTITVTTINKEVYTSGRSGGRTAATTTVSQAYTGTVNDFTGAAMADGSLGKLYSGAQLAHKTLVGELGPELAVYNGQYHLLGKTGAEFVKLPNDAIVFNHLQTAGILSGQMKNARAQNAMVTGNVSGPAAASGIGAALSAVRRAKSVWQGLLNSLSAADLMGAGGSEGGGGGDDKSLKAHIEDLQEWYNLSRQIAQLEQQINNLLAERENITDGHKYLQNLRETQSLLEDQVNTQDDLLKFQQLQLKAQEDFINNHEIWSQFLKVDESGLLQYREGNETNGGKGALEVLQDLNEMSGQEQLDFITGLGYSAQNNEGEALEGEELVAKFYEDLQKQIDDYDALMDTVNETEAALEELETQINEIDQEIRQNEMDLSQDIYDIIVKSWEENIKQLKEQNDLIKEANDAYAESVQKAIDSERNAYEQNQSIADREQLQRQLSLLRRSGGSASEIADLEQQLSDTLKDEYFQKQEEALETIRDANERQVELMEVQVKLQEDALAYEQENGVIWSKTFDVMLGNDAQILDFMQGNSTEFFEKSYLEQEDMLLNWAKMVGIYNEDKVYDYYTEQGKGRFADIWQNNEAKQWQSFYNKIDPAKQEELKREYLDRYASSLLDGADETEAMTKAQRHFIEHLENYKKALEAEERIKQQAAASFGGSSNGGSSGGGSSSNGNRSGTRKNNKSSKQQSGRTPQNEYIIVDTKTGNKSAVKVGEPPRILKPNQMVLSKFKKGGLADYTGPAWVDGTKSKPEGFLNAEQTAILREGLDIAGKADSIKNSLTEMFVEILQASTKPLRSYVESESDSNISIAPGAITIQVQELNDKYDVDDVANDVMDKIYSIASRATSRGVSRR